MRQRRRDFFTTVRTEGGLLPSDFLRRVLQLDKDVGGLNPEDYHLAKNDRINEAINRSWNYLTGRWTLFREQEDILPTDDPGTTVTREQWLLPLFQELGYGRIQTSRALTLGDDPDGKRYPISHLWQNVPIHLVGSRIDLDRRTPGVVGAARMSPHGMVQELLNRSEDHLWAFLSNGGKLRILRDNISLTRQAYVEFDIEQMMDGQVYADFQLLWMLCHVSRVEAERPSQFWMERWKESAQRQGTRALDQLRDGVEKAIESLGRGFLTARTSSGNDALREKLRRGDLTTQDYYRQLLRLVYRLLFLFVAEERELLFPPLSDDETQRQGQLKARRRYGEYYSTRRLRERAARPRGTQHPDLWRGLGIVMRALDRQGCPQLDLSPLGSFLWSDDAMPDLVEADIANRDLLVAVHRLAYVQDRHLRRPVDYKNLGSEELGSVYESLLELHPELNIDANTFALSSAAGHERKTTGSYYTPESLVQALLDSALDPVLDAVVKGKRGDDAEKAILGLKVCDPASGSGHFLIAAAHRIARRLAAIRSHEAEPSPAEYQKAVRDVVRNCLYGVDVNPMAVELCKVSLWMESLDPGLPLTFLDHRIQCGDSLIGVFDLETLRDGISNDAFKVVTGDDKQVAAAIRRQNRDELKALRDAQTRIEYDAPQVRMMLTDQAAVYLAAESDTVQQVEEQGGLYDLWRDEPERRQQEIACDLWTAAFFAPLTDENRMDVPTTQRVMNCLHRGVDAIPTSCARKAWEIAQRLRFFHWHLEFPEVFAEEGGFDVVLSNPPWEKIKLEELEFFPSRDPRIAAETNKAARSRLIKQLTETNPGLAREFADAKHDAAALSKFARKSDRFPLTSMGDINTYAVFSELSLRLLNAKGRAGIIVKTGIATEDTCKGFFQDLTEKRALSSLYDFENRPCLFADVATAGVKFCLLTMSRKPTAQGEFAFFLTRTEHLSDDRRRFSLSPEDFARINPNTKTCPIFRTRRDAEITRKIYERVPVLINEATGENPWGIRFLRMLDMSNDSGLFYDAPDEGLLPLYEAKMIHQYDHRWATYENGKTRNVTEAEKQDPEFAVRPRYWVEAEEVDARLGEWKQDWLLGFRDVTRPTEIRTAIFSVLPRVGVGNNMPILFSHGCEAPKVACLLASLNSLVFDYVVRQKIAGTHMNFFFVKQLPVLAPSAYKSEDVNFIVPRVIALVYTSWEMVPFTNDVRFTDEALEELIVEQGSWGATEGRVFEDDEELQDTMRAYGAGWAPFKWWDEDRRALVRAELDAYFAKLYGLTRDELRYILDPHDVYGEDFPSETFRVLKEKEMRHYGEYRTKRLVLEAWDRLQQG